MKAERFRPAIVIVLVLLALSFAIRLYFVHRWKDLPTSDSYFFVAWASGIAGSAHLDFPGSEDSAYGDYPSGYAMLTEMMSSASGIPILSLAKLLPLIIGSLCTLPVYLALRRITPHPVYCAAGTGLVVFSFTFIKYTSVSIPNMVGLYFFPLVAWIALGRAWTSKRMLAVLVMTVAAVSRIHYLSLVCIGVLLAIVASRSLMLRASGRELDVRRIAFLLIVALVAGVLAWTAAYRIMLSIYGIDITTQPPARLSQATRPQGYPLIFGLVQTVALPFGLYALASLYHVSNFRGKAETTMDALLLFVTWLTFQVFASGFFRVEYYPFRFNSFLMLPMAMISVLGLRYLEHLIRRRSAVSRLAGLMVPVALVLAALQPVTQSFLPMDQGESLLPWTQEYGRVEIPAMEWCQANLLLSLDDGRLGGTGNTSDGLRQRILLADWVRSRALRALGFEKVHLHWWFFQGVNILTGEPNPFSGLEIYSANISEALLLLGRLNLRSVQGLEEAYYYKYIYTSDWMAELIRWEFKKEADFQKFDEYDGRYAYFAMDDPELDYVTNRSYLPPGHTRKAGPGGEVVRFLSPDILLYRLRPFDKVYSTTGVALYDRVSLTPGYYTARKMLWG